MKKLILILLIALSAAAVFGCGKKKEEETEPEALLQPLKEAPVSGSYIQEQAEAETNTVGPMVLYPTDDEYMGALAGSNTITLYFQNRNVVAGVGRVGIYDASSGAVFSTVDVSDLSSCTYLPMDEQGMNLTGWDDGTMVELSFDNNFVAGTRYYVLMDPGCFMLGEVESKAVTNASLLRFTTKPYGITSAIEEHYEPGDMLDLSVLTGGDCERVRITEYDPNFIYVPEDYTDGSMPLQITFLESGTPSFKIGFMDSTQEIDSVTVTVTVGSGIPYDMGTESGESEDGLVVEEIDPANQETT